MTSYPKRLYRTVEVAPVSEADRAYSVLLDSKPAATPARTELRLPTRHLAEAVAEEWRAQGAEVVFPRMPLTRLAFTAIDRVAPNRDTVIDQIAAFGATDLVCYRAAAPSDLVERQRHVWDPLLDWAARELGIALATGEGLGIVRQPENSLAKLHDALASHDDYTLAAIHVAAELCGSAVIALALLRCHLDAEAAFQAANLDELYQAQKWGDDAEARLRRTDRARNLRKLQQFMRLVHENP